MDKAIRDHQSGAIINGDAAGLAAYKERRGLLQRIKTLEDRLGQISKEVEYLKQKADNTGE